MDSADSAWLVAQCLAGNDSAIEAFIRQYEADVFRLALSIVDDAAEATEIAQETFIAALKALRQYEERRSLKAWVYVIALNICRSHLRKKNFLDRLKASAQNLLKLEQQKQPSLEERVVQNEREAALWNELNQLDERHRLVVILRYFHELPIAEIAEILSIQEGTVHSRLHTARERLRLALTHHGD